MLPVFMSVYDELHKLTEGSKINFNKNFTDHHLLCLKFVQLDGIFISVMHICTFNINATLCKFWGFGDLFGENV